jgi:hypothetical protein
MTEAEWRTGTDLDRLFRFVSGRLTDRKVRLLNCASCRLIWRLIDSERWRQAVAVAEAFADRGVTLPTLREAWELADADYRAEMTQYAAHKKYQAMLRYCVVSTVSNTAFHESFFPAFKSGNGPCVGHKAARAVACEAMPPAADPADDRVRNAFLAVVGDEEKTHLPLLRDIAGNPFRPAAADPRWLTSTAVDLAHTMYESRDFSPMPILADALEEAGCGDADVLAHCRGDGPHVRGCWVVDLLLGKQ